MRRSLTNLNRQSDSRHHHAAPGGSWLLVFARDPFADERRAISKRDAVAFARPQEADDLSIHEDDVLEIQNEGAARRFGGEQRGQFAHVVGPKPTAQGEDNVAVFVALDFQHRRPTTNAAIAWPAQDAESKGSPRCVY